MTNEDLKSRIYDISSELEDLLYDIKGEIVDMDDSACSISEWKKNVIKNLPLGCSVAFRMKVEEMLDKIEDE